LASDLGETRNVAREHPEVAARMRQLMREAHVDTEHFRIAGE
jgi:hypothetical protein